MVRNYDSTLHLKHMKLRLQIFLHAPPTLQLGCLMKCKVYNEPKLLVIQELPWVLRLRVCTLHFVYVLLLLAWILDVRMLLLCSVHDVTARTTFCNIGPPFHYLKKRPYIHDLTFAFFVPNSFGSWQIFCIENLWFVEKGSVSCVCSERMVYHMTSLLK